jgi:multidrug resistance protein
MSHSIRSLESEEEEQQQEEQFDPAPYDPEDDVQSDLSRVFTSITQNSIRPTETMKSLHEAGLQGEINPQSYINAPSVMPGQMFPEEYTLETETGLVPIQTLQSLGRIRTHTSHSRRPSRVPSAREEDSSSLEKQEQDLGEGVEFVTFVINDPENPYNWPTWKKWLYTINLSVLVIAVAFGSSCVTGGLGLIEDQFNVSSEVATLTCSLMVLGFAVGPLLWSPLSEQIGRRPVYFISLFLYVIFNIPCALAPNIGALLVCRFLCGVWASSGLSLVGGSIADMFSMETRGEAIAYFAFAPYCGPVFGPLVCGWINIKTERFDLIIWVNMAFAGVMWITSTLVPETYAPVILKRRAQRLRKETGNDKIMTEQEAQGLSLKELVQTCLVRPLYFTISEPVLDLMCFYVCLIYALLYAFFFAYPVIFSELYGYNDAFIGLMMIPILMGACAALVTTPILERSYIKLTKRRTPTPEDRLMGAMIGAPFAAVALWILGATSYEHIIWVGPASSGLAFGYGMVLIYYSINNYIIDCYAKYASSALATKVFLRSAGGAAFPLFTPQMYHKLGLNWASWLLAFIASAMVLIPYAFYFYGKTLRAKLSKNDYSVME